MTLETQMYDAELAGLILENKVFQQVFIDIETELVEAWKSSNNAADRESLHLNLSMMEKVKQRLQTTLSTGKLARREIEHKRSLFEKLVMQRQSDQS